MTVYEFLLHAARSYSGVVNGGKTEEIRIDLTRKSIWSGRLPIMREGKLLLKSVRLENGELCKLEGLIDFEGDAYAEIEDQRRIQAAVYDQLNNAVKGKE